MHSSTKGVFTAALEYAMPPEFVLAPATGRATGDSSRSRVHEMTAWLEKFSGMNVMELAQFLRKEDIRGIPQNKVKCPWAVFFRQSTSISVYVSGNHLTFADPVVGQVRMPLPPSMQKFITLYDSGIFPFLIEKDWVPRPRMCVCGMCTTVNAETYKFYADQMSSAKLSEDLANDMYQMLWAPQPIG